MKVFRSSSFFGGFLVLMRSPTKNPLTFGRTCQMAIFAPSNREMVKAFMKNLPPKKSSFLKKSRVKIPLVMGVPLKKASRNSTDSKCYFSEMSSRKKKLWQSKALSRTNSGHWAVLHPIPVQCFRQFWKKNIEIAGLYRLSTKKVIECDF